MKDPPKQEEVKEPLLLRPQEAARALALSRSTIYAMIASGELAAIRVGRTLRIPSQALRDWVAANTSADPYQPNSAQKPEQGRKAE